jgi:Flp pilus assembly protein TadD
MQTHLFQSLIILVGLFTLSACSSTPPTPPPIKLTQINSFKSHTLESPEEIFTLSDSLKQQLQNHLKSQQSAQALAHSILSFLLKNGDDSLSYQSAATLTASQTFKNLNANCLSLSILAYSLADYLGIKARFNKVHIPEYWALNNGFNLLTGHINLSIDIAIEPSNQSVFVYQGKQRLTIDFDPNSRQARFKTTPISKQTITAMFYNNKGAIALVNKQYDLAYNYFSHAVKADPNFSAGWGNLGVLFRQLNYLTEAEKAYTHAISLNQDNNTAQGNLAVLYQLTGRSQLGTNILKKLHIKRQNNPYYHISLGNTEFEQSNFALALAHYKKAYSLSPSLHESHFGQARVYFKWGNTQKATYHLEQAGKKADFLHDKKRYESKLDTLRSLTAKL